MSNRDTVAIKRVTTYDAEVLDAAVEEIFLDCFPKGIDPDARVCIKPNLLMRAKPDEAVTTHPAVITAVVRALKRRGFRHILIADSPGGIYTRPVLQAVYTACGLMPLNKEGVRFNDDTKSGEITADGKRVKKFPIIEPVLSADVLINVSKLKTHAMCGMTAASKNLFGSLPGLKKTEMHSRFPKREIFAEMLVDLAETIKPTLSIVDGVVGMEGDGPSGGSPRAFSILAGSANHFHLDRFLASYIGIPMEEALTVAESVKRGLAPAKAVDVALSGDVSMLDHPIRDLKLPRTVDTDFSLRVAKPLRPIARVVLSRLSSWPHIEKKRCIGCARCAEICPQQVITIKNRKAVINHKKCIRCFCCHEICPARAIDIRKSLFFKL